MVPGQRKKRAQSRQVPRSIQPGGQPPSQQAQPQNPMGSLFGMNTPMQGFGNPMLSRFGQK